MEVSDDEGYEDEDNADALPYYQQSMSQPPMPQKGFLATAGVGCLHFIVTHIALYLCLGTMLFGGTALVKEIARLGWHGASTILWDGLLIVAYVVIVIGFIAIVSRLGKRITRDKNF